MSAIKSGVRPAVAGGILAAIFVASVGVSAAGAFATAPGESEAPTAMPAPSASPSPEPSRTADSSTSTEPSDESSSDPAVTPVSTAPTKATKAQVKQGKSALCQAEPGNLPKLDFQSGSRQWVKTLEILAADRGFRPGAIDGIFNIQTRNAIKSFEEALGVAVDGVMDTAAWQALWDDLCAPDPVYVPQQPTYTPPSGGGGSSSGGGGGGLSRLD